MKILFIVLLVSQIAIAADTADKNSPCFDGMKLGYVKKPKGKCTYCAFTNRVDRSKLYGEFSSLSECEESRILDSDKFDTSKGCYWRYIKKNKLINYYEAIAMRNMNKHSVVFKNKKVCDQAVRKGYQYTFFREIIKIGPKGSKKRNRFIKNCELKTDILCERHKGDSSLFILERLQW